MRISDICFVTGAQVWKQLPEDGLPEVAFVGRSNVGKSSLINMLAGRPRLARTSRTPGKTQQFNCYRVNKKFYFVDLPGYGYARVARTQRNRWSRFIQRYLAERVSLRAVLHLIDSRHAPSQQDREMFYLLGHLPRIIVLTKADKLSGNGRRHTLVRMQNILREELMEVPFILSSAKNKQGRQELLTWIGDFVL